MANNESSEIYPSEKDLEELRDGVMKHPALALFADEKTRQKIIFGDIKRPTEYDKDIVQESDSTEVYVKSQFAYLAKESAYIGRYLEKWTEEKIEGEIAEWYKRAGCAFTYRLVPIHKSCEEVEDILAKRLHNLREDFKVSYKDMLAVAKQCDIDRTKLFGFVPVKLIEKFKLAAEEFHKIIYTIHTEALVELKKLTESKSDLASAKKNVTTTKRRWYKKVIGWILKKTSHLILTVIVAIFATVVAAIVVDIFADFGWLQSIKAFIYSILWPK